LSEFPSRIGGKRTERSIQGVIDGLCSANEESPKIEPSLSKIKHEGIEDSGEPTTWRSGVESSEFESSLELLEES